MKNENVEIFQDKIRLSAVFVEKELDLIHNFTNLLAKLKQGIILKDDIDRHPDFYITLQNLTGLYLTLETPYKERLKEEEQNKIEKIILKFKNLEQIEIEELIAGVDIVRKMMALTGFHDVMRRTEEADGWANEPF